MKARCELRALSLSEELTSICSIAHKRKAGAEANIRHTGEDVCSVARVKAGGEHHVLKPGAQLEAVLVDELSLGESQGIVEVTELAGEERVVLLRVAREAVKGNAAGLQ